MDEAFKITETGRSVILQILNNHSLEQLNMIPPNFNNNLIWNAGHIVVVQQMLIYKLSGLPMQISDEMVVKYQRGSKPEADVDNIELDEIKRLLITTNQTTKADFDAGIFKNYHEFTNMSKYTMRSAADAIAFNYYHEAMHTGMMMSIRKFL